MKRIILFVALSFCCNVLANTSAQSQTNSVRIVSNKSNYCLMIQESFTKFGIPFELTDAIGIDSDHLYILFDVFAVAENALPPFFIAYQTLDVEKNDLTNEYLQKLSKAVAIWDYSRSNIKKYEKKLQNYSYFPIHYQYVDPIILPCFLPLSFLPAFKEILSYSNKKDTDISSHLPAIFCYGILQAPKLILEVGICTGESTVALHKATLLFNANLLGVDIENDLPAKVYANRQNATFLCMDDRYFTNYFISSKYANQLFDIIFVDTSHEYMHTMQEIKQFVPLLGSNGIMIFHDSNVTPLLNGTGYVRINDTIGHAGGNTRGVTQAIKEYFECEFDEYQYINRIFENKNARWHIVHYPFCNGLTIMRLLERR